MAVRLELPAQVMRPNARLHADEAGPVETDEVERVLADVDADCSNGFKAIDIAWHGMLLIL